MQGIAGQEQTFRVDILSGIEDVPSVSVWPTSQL